LNAGPSKCDEGVGNALKGAAKLGAECSGPDVLAALFRECRAELRRQQRIRHKKEHCQEDEPLR